MGDNEKGTGRIFWVMAGEYAQSTFYACMETE
jgi:hypothetical protein